MLYFDVHHRLKLTLSVKVCPDPMFFRRKLEIAILEANKFNLAFPSNLLKKVDKEILHADSGQRGRRLKDEILPIRTDNEFLRKVFL